MCIIHLEHDVFKEKCTHENVYAGKRFAKYILRAQQYFFAIPLSYGGIIHTGSKGLTHLCVHLSNTAPLAVIQLDSL